MAEITALIISRETVGGARKLLEMRRGHGIEDPLEIILIDLVGAPEQVAVALAGGARRWCWGRCMGSDAEYSSECRSVSRGGRMTDCCAVLLPYPCRWRMRPSSRRARCAISSAISTRRVHPRRERRTQLCS